MKRNYSDRNSYRYFNIIACNIHVEQFLNATHYTLYSSALYSCRFRGSAATRRRRELTLSGPVWCHGSILWYDIVWRWGTLYEMMLKERYHCSKVPTYRRDAAKLQVAKVYTFFCVALYPGKSFGLKFIPNQSDSFLFIPKSVSAPIRTHPSQSEKSFQSRLM